MPEPSQVVLRFTVPGEPCSKARPRWSPRTRKAYTPEKTRAREGVIQALGVAARQTPPDALALFAVSSTFYLWSNQMRDIDNLAKLVLDGLKGVVWADDSQVIRLVAAKERAVQETDARTEVVVERLAGQLPWTFGHCTTCQRPFRTYPSWKYRQFCSRRCWAIGTRARTEGDCQCCGKRFEIRRYEAETRLFCSRDCKRKAHVEPTACTGCGRTFDRPVHLAKNGRRPTCSKACAIAVASSCKAKYPQQKCLDCGGPVSRKEYSRCRRCFIGARMVVAV